MNNFKPENCPTKIIGEIERDINIDLSGRHGTIATIRSLCRRRIGNMIINHIRWEIEQLIQKQL